MPASERRSTAKPKKVNLALQGGGAHAAVAWGVLDRLLECGHLEIDSISGASAGAVNAAALAYGIHLGGPARAREKLEELWREISRAGEIYSPMRSMPFEGAFAGFNPVGSFAYHAFDILTRTFSPYQFNPFDINPLRDILAKCIDFESLRECTRTQLFISATNVRSGKVRVFHTHEMSTDVVLASSCLPYIFQAVKVNGEHYWDGGYMGNPVLFPFFYEAESADIVIVHVNPVERDKVPTTSSEIMDRINEISFNSSLLRELRAISFVEKLLDDGWLKPEYRDRLRKIHIHSVRSDRAIEDLSVASKFNVDWTFLTELRDRGRKVADDWINDTLDLVGRKSSIDLRAMFSPDNPDGWGDEEKP